VRPDALDEGTLCQSRLGLWAPPAVLAILFVGAPSQVRRRLREWQIFSALIEERQVRTRLAAGGSRIRRKTFSHQHIFSPQTPMVRRLAAGGNRIRTLGPARNGRRSELVELRAETNVARLSTAFEFCSLHRRAKRTSTAHESIAMIGEVCAASRRAVFSSLIRRVPIPGIPVSGIAVIVMGVG
jgi:hypothetical protein